MYEVALDEAWELFDEHLDGARLALVCVASGSALSERSRAALNSAMASLGYGSGACTFAAVEGLDDQALFLLVEGLDPLCLIATDSTAAAALGRAYRCEVPLGSCPASENRKRPESSMPPRRSTYKCFT